ncbi:metallophosphoesterase [Stieleria sp. TO1_6]|uniref:metallophosphoesterase family protein n=1 Tax=Stieleria tagensis TaxID=2956795 RepID=UPI00209B283A|nr:metallophosphoesterase [Stieleria tagensis]MCO8122919.1 metallophosphoesterase [Stieleria tagensis]
MNRDPVRLGRRTFLQGSSVVLAASSAAAVPSFASEQRSGLQFALVTDLHYADKPAAGSRFYRETLGKLQEAGQRFEQDKPDFLVELGDLIDAADAVETELSYLQTINQAFSAICPDRHYVLGNHCVDMLTKPEFLGGVKQAESYYSFDRAGVHFVVLDACFRSDGKPYGRKNSVWTDANVPAEELKWLAADLAATDKQVIVFAHQRLDVSNNHGVKNNAQVRKLLEDSGKVLAVFQGHSHHNDLNDIGGIHYCTLVAMVEGSGESSNGYSLVNVSDSGDIQLTGFRKQQNYRWMNHR